LWVQSLELEQLQYGTILYGARRRRPIVYMTNLHTLETIPTYNVYRSICSPHYTCTISPRKSTRLSALNTRQPSTHTVSSPQPANRYSQRSFLSFRIYIARDTNLPPLVHKRYPIPRNLLKLAQTGYSAKVVGGIHAAVTRHCCTRSSAASVE
jgi:hypothetical protein